ncbi:MAG: hypothetical protein ACLP5V_07525 [Candidatus Bathyarchaeia archaeon]
MSEPVLIVRGVIPTIHAAINPGEQDIKSYLNLTLTVSRLTQVI